MNHKLSSAVLIALSASLALAGCKRDRDADDATPPPAASTPAPATTPADPPAMATVRVTSVDLGNQVGADNRVASPMTTFATSDTLHASVVTKGDGGTVSTKWSFQDGQVVHTEDKIVPAGEQVTDFMVTNPQGWPTGIYTVQVMADGQVVQTREFEVR